MIGLYLHIPFCKCRCIYCDFFSSTLTDVKGRYVEALCRELEMRRNEAQGHRLQTVYLGGGTPSQLSPMELEHIFEYIYKVYDVDANAEITLEANPDDLDAAYVDALRSLPVNRVSMGVQTLDDKLLCFLKRRHTARQVVEALDRLHQAGMTNLSIDLIYGLPGQTLSGWERDLEQVLAWRLPHISAYSLIYEQGTALWKMLQEGKIEEVSEEQVALMYATLTHRLKGAGYEHYEISNFCLPSMESRHNSAYWRAVPYIGCGAAAHSFDGFASRRWNVSSIPEYIDGIMSGHPVSDGEVLDLPTRYNDYMVTAMRTKCGASMNEVESRFGTSFKEYCLHSAKRYIQKGMLLLHADKLSLSCEGVFVSDGIISDLLWVD